MVLNRVRLYTLPPLSLLAGSGLALALCLSLLLSSPIQRKSAFQERDITSESVPDGYTHNGKADPNAMLDLRMALPWRNRDGLEEKLYDVSNPKSANYGKHLTAEQVREYVQPSEETMANVTQWLQNNGVTYEPMGNGEWLKMSASVSQIESMLNTSLNNYTHDATGKQYVRATSHEIPNQLKQHIQAIHPVTGLPKPVLGRPKVKPGPSSTDTNLVSRSAEDSASVESLLQSCNEAVTPSCVQFLYSLPNTTTLQSKTAVAVEGFDSVPRKEDLEKYIELFRPDVTKTPTFQIVSINGGVTTDPPPSSSDQSDNTLIEVNLDIQSVLGIAPNASAFFMSGLFEDGDTFIQSLIDTNIAIFQLDPQPSVLSISFGVDETNPTTTDSDIALMKAACDSFMQVGIQGVTVLFASGDGGVDGVHGQVNCTTGFIGVFPASCPYVTAVGATQLSSELNEVAAGFSSGGFSNIFPMPSYQTNSTAVSNYLEQLGDLNEGLFNASGRGFPDVSAIGVNVSLVLDGDGGRTSGTSASAPLFAGVVALINDRLASANQSPLGFLNPLLYSGTLDSGFQDITEGNNPGCGTNGFPAATGWDPITGIGTPNFPEILKALGV